jgi:hypothetical protein
MPRVRPRDIYYQDIRPSICTIIYIYLRIAHLPYSIQGTWLGMKLSVVPVIYTKKTKTKNKKKHTECLTKLRPPEFALAGGTGG